MRALTTLALFAAGAGLFVLAETQCYEQPDCPGWASALAVAGLVMVLAAVLLAIGLALGAARRRGRRTGGD